MCFCHPHVISAGHHLQISSCTSTYTQSMFKGVVASRHFYANWRANLPRTCYFMQQRKKKRKERKEERKEERKKERKRTLGSVMNNTSWNMKKQLWNWCLYIVWKKNFEKLYQKVVKPLLKERYPKILRKIFEKSPGHRLFSSSQATISYTVSFLVEKITKNNWKIKQLCFFVYFYWR